MSASSTSTVTTRRTATAVTIGLVHLLANKEAAEMSESAVEIKKLLQTYESEHRDIVSHMAGLVDTAEVAKARTAIL